MGRELARLLAAQGCSVGEDAKMLDAAVRAKPEAAYDHAELFSELLPEPPARPRAPTC